MTFDLVRLALERRKEKWQFVRASFSLNFQLGRLFLESERIELRLDIVAGRTVDFGVDPLENLIFFVTGRAGRALDPQSNSILAVENADALTLSSSDYPRTNSRNYGLFWRLFRCGKLIKEKITLSGTGSAEESSTFIFLGATVLMTRS